MLKFTKDIVNSRKWRTIWKAVGNCETDFDITAIGGKYYVTVYQYGRFVEDTGSFPYFADAKKWANTQDAYLEGI